MQLDDERQERERIKKWEEEHRIGNVPDLLSLDGWTESELTAQPHLQTHQY